MGAVHRGSMSVQNQVAALCVARDSIYHLIQDVDAYDIDRDARTFEGGLPVVAHPPCRAWSAFCRHQAKPLPGEAELAPFCIEQILKWGGVLEHPAHSSLWKRLNLPRPWEPRRKNGLWTIEVKQAWWGDARSKDTWVLINGVDLVTVPMTPHDSSFDSKAWAKLSKRKRAETPYQFAKWLVNIAKQCDLQS